MRFRRLNSWMAVTIASRFVFALVNRIASSRSLSGILTVVFMIPFYLSIYSRSMTTGILGPMELQPECGVATSVERLHSNRSLAALGQSRDFRLLPERAIRARAMVIKKSNNRL